MGSPAFARVIAASVWKPPVASRTTSTGVRAMSRGPSGCGVPKSMYQAYLK